MLHPSESRSRPERASVNAKRIEARVAPEKKLLYEQAAGLKGISLTEFILSAVDAEAIRVVQERKIIKVVLAESAAFVAALENPPKPSPEAVDRFVRAAVLHSAKL